MHGCAVAAPVTPPSGDPWIEHAIKARIGRVHGSRADGPLPKAVRLADLELEPVQIFVKAAGWFS
jgi:hypothetical protein